MDSFDDIQCEDYYRDEAWYEYTNSSAAGTAAVVAVVEFEDVPF